MSILDHSKVHCTVIIIFRYYVGKTPIITIADVDLAKEILVKEFDTFSDRGLAVSMVNYWTRFFELIVKNTGILPWQQ